MTIPEAEQIIATTKPKMTSARAARIDKVVAGRTHNLVVVAEKITDTGNINACMRSAEGMGVVDFHVIEAENTFFRKGRRTSMGANKWLKIKRWQSTAECVAELKKQGLQVVATAVGDKAVPITQVDFTKPTALVLGNEHAGVSDELLAAADVTAYIPMSGFVESFNISVACALSIYTAALNRGNKHADITEDQATLLTAVYYQRATQHLKPK